MPHSVLPLSQSQGRVPSRLIWRAAPVLVEGSQKLFRIESWKVSIVLKEK